MLLSMDKNQDKKDFLDLPYFNSTTYPLAIKGQLSKIKFDEEDSKKLRYHQFIVKEFFTRNPNQRGLLICHGMGQGKTRLAVSIADVVRNLEPARRIIVLSAKSLEANFRKEIISYTGKDDEYIDQNYKFISLNAGNMFKTISNVDKTDEAAELEKRLGDFMDDVIRESSLENSLLIIDEAHNLFNSITNGAKNALALYDLIMQTSNIKLLFMSGTPIINDPFELVPCYNMLRGPIKIDIKGSAESDNSEDDDDTETSNVTNTVDDEAETNATNLEGRNNAFSKKNKFKKRSILDKSKPINFKSYTTLFSEDINDFIEYFIDTDNKKIKNKDKFTNRIYGLSSYYGDNYFKIGVAKQGFPTELDTIIEKIPMSQVQYARYISARILEQEETKNKFTTAKSRFSAASGSFSTYRVKSRQISNYCIPEYALGIVIGAKSRKKYIDKIKLDDLHNLDKFSPKMAKIIKNIEKHPNQKGIIYSQFVSGEGIAIFAKVLSANGYKLFGEENFGADANDIDINPVGDAGNETGGETDNETGSETDNETGGETDNETGSETDNETDNKTGNIVSDNIKTGGKSTKSPTKPVTKSHTKSHTKSVTKPPTKSPTKSVSKTFAILSGDINPEIRAEIIKKFNEKNTDINLLLLSGAVAEGIDLKRVRHVHIMEPFWNYARINQVKTRAIRFLSHEDLPIDEQNVQTYIYLSDYPEGTPKNKMTEPTTDIDLYTKSIDNMHIINTFIDAIAESSIDCAMHYDKLDDEIKAKFKCKLCSPDGAMLYHPLITKDMNLPNTCKPNIDKKVMVKSIILPDVDEKFYYNKATSGEFKIYHFNKKLNGYAPILRSHPLYADIMEAVVLSEVE